MYLNQCCWCGRIRAFLETSKEDWLAEMELRHRSASPYKLESSNINAWANSWDVLHEVFSKMDDAFLDLHIIFEYCMPRTVTEDGPAPDRYIWADAVIVGRHTAVVLEFKNRPDAIIHHARQAKMYRTRLQKYHDESRGMRKWAVLIPTQANDMLMRPISRVTACSPDRLAEVLRSQFGDCPKARRTIKAWKHSSYSNHELLLQQRSVQV